MMMEDNVVFVGIKPVTNYVMACVYHFENDATAVTLKARGRAINKAVDVAEVLKNKFMKGLVETPIVNIGTEQVRTFPAEPTDVSAIEITIKLKVK